MGLKNFSDPLRCSSRPCRHFWKNRLNFWNLKKHMYFLSCSASEFSGLSALFSGHVIRLSSVRRGLRPILAGFLSLSHTAICGESNCQFTRNGQAQIHIVLYLLWQVVQWQYTSLLMLYVVNLAIWHHCWFWAGACWRADGPRVQTGGKLLRQREGVSR